MISLKHLTAYAVLAVTIGSGSISLLLFGFFLFGTSFTIADFGYEQTGILLWDALLCLLFFFQHSVMIRKGFRHRLAKIVPDHVHGALFTVASAVVLVALVLLWQRSPQTILSLQGPWRWTAYGIFFACLIGMLWGMRALGSVDLLGTRPLLDRNKAATVRSATLSVRGPYRWVRHPLYFLTLVMIWSCPDVTLDRLLFNVLFTSWIVLGTLLEERDLVADFGQAYVDYQRRVPMLVPYRILASSGTRIR